MAPARDTEMPSDITASESGAESDEQPAAALERALSECEHPEVAYHIRQALQHIESQ